MTPAIGNRSLYQFSLLFLLMTTFLFAMQMAGLNLPFGAFSLPRDPMYITGFLTILPALWISLLAEGKSQEASRQLEKDALVSFASPDSGLSAYVRDKVSTWQSRGAWAVGLTVLVGYLSFYYQGYAMAAWDCGVYQKNLTFGCMLDWLHPDYLEWTRNRSPFVIISVLFGVVTGARLGTLAASSMMAHHLTRHPDTLNVFPNHPDGCGGFRRFCEVISFNGVLAAVPVVWLGIWINALKFSSSQNIDAFRSWLWPFMGQISVALVFLAICFAWPAIRFSIAFRREKRNAEQNLLEQRHNKTLDDETYHESVSNVRALPDFPVGGFLGRVFTVAAAFPFFTAALQVFLATIGDDPRFVALLQGTRTFVANIFGL